VFCTFVGAMGEADVNGAVAPQAVNAAAHDKIHSPPDTVRNMASPTAT